MKCCARLPRRLIVAYHLVLGLVAPCFGILASDPETLEFLLLTSRQLYIMGDTPLASLSLTHVHYVSHTISMHLLY